MPIVAVLVLGVVGIGIGGERDDEPAVTAPATPRSGMVDPWQPELWTGVAAAAPYERGVAGRTAVVPVAPSVADIPAVPAPGPEPGGEQPAPEPDGPVVNRPPPAPNRVAPEPEQPPQDEPPEPPSSQQTAVYPGEFPDPFVLRANGFYWAFSTQAGMTKVPTLRSSDLVNWEWVGDAMPELPSWAEWGHNWAPAVLARGSTYVLFHTARHRATGLQCISRAVSVLPQGPYLDQSSEPMICQTERGGSIDPSPFVDVDGRAWLLWKSEGTLQGEPTRIWVQRLADDGLSLLGDGPHQLLERHLEWEFPIIEGPSMVRVDGRYHLLYSGNRWETAGYAVGHAVCDTVVGPCRRTTPGPVLATRAGEAGPGGQEVTTAPTGELVLVHHAWSPEAVGYARGGTRRLHVSSLRFDGDRVVVGGPWGRRGPSDLFDPFGPP